MVCCRVLFVVVCCALFVGRWLLFVDCYFGVRVVGCVVGVC